MLFLTSQELRLLTGRIKHSAQIRQLRAQAIDYLIDADGHPLVLRATLASRGGVHSPDLEIPDFDALHA